MTPTTPTTVTVELATSDRVRERLDEHEIRRLFGDYVGCYIATGDLRPGRIILDRRLVHGDADVEVWIDRRDDRLTMTLVSEREA